MNNFDFKKLLPYLGVLVFFIGISLGYFYPQLSGKQLATHDQKQFRGSAKEINDYYEETGEIALWSNAMFGGMPSYFVVMRYTTNYMSKYVRPLTTLGLERPAIYIIWSLVSFFILMMVLKVDIPIGVMGSIGYAFTSYNFVILAAGHFAKVMALGYLPGILAGAILLRQKKYWLGATVTAIFMSFEMISNHPQMTYYFFVFFIAIYFLLEFIADLKKGDAKGYLVSAALFGGSILLGVMPSAASLMVAQEYSAYSTRGKSELTITDSQDATTGLDRSYITNWSGGIAETWSLMIPHAKGPGSSRIAEHKTAMKQVDRQYKKPMEGFDAYWGDQPFVGGPMYAGAIIIFLFVLGLFIVDGMLKWSLLGATVITTMLSWGKNFEGLTNFFIDNFPLYNKFRAVVSIEIVTLFALPVLAALALKKVYDSKDFMNEPLSLFGKETKYKNSHALYLSFALTGGLSFLFWLMPGTFFDFFKAGEYDNYMNSLQSNGWQVGQIGDLLANVEAARMALFTSDALRSFGFIAVAFGLIWASLKGKLSSATATYIIVALVLVDMWGVNTRYMDVTTSFESKRKVEDPYPMLPANQAILADNSPDVRVLNIAVSTFNETSTSNFHHSIGGYTGVKLKKYQEVIDFYIGSEIQKFMGVLRNAKTMADLNVAYDQIPVLNMLNTKYIIYDPNSAPVQNPKAQTGAWFVNNVNWVEDADAEMQALGTTDLQTTAVLRKDQKDVLGEAGNGNGTIVLETYSPNKLTYRSNSSSEQIAVLSEIWYPAGWTATIDGEPLEIGRANYLLRSVRVPAGEHVIEFTFAPSSYYTGEKIAFAGSTLLILLILGAIYLQFKGNPLQKEE